MAPLLVWLAIVVMPRPAGLSRQGWSYLGLFAGVIVALVLEPLPPAAVGMIGVTLAMIVGDVAAKPADAIKWGLSGFSDGTVWLIFGALTLSTGYEKTGLGRRIALSLVKVMGRSTLGLGYAVMLADLAIAPFTPSNTGRSAGVIFPIVRGIPALYGSAPGPTARRLGAYLMWTAFAATSVTSSMFLTALAPNLLALGLMKQEIALDITWSQWLLGFLPVGALLIAVLPLLVYLIYPPEIRSSPDVPAWAEAELARMGKLSAREGLMGFLILLAFVLWVFGAAWIHATTAILAVVSLMVLLRVLDWDDVVGNRAAWDTMVYFATLMALADGLNRVGRRHLGRGGRVAATDRRTAPGCADRPGLVLLRGPLRLRQPDRSHGGRVPRAARGGGGIPRHAREGVRDGHGLLDRPDGRDHALRHRPGPGLFRQRVHPAKRFLDPGIRVRVD